MKIISQAKYLIDTNVLVYAVDSASLFHKVCADIVQWGADGEYQLVLAQQNILECVSVLTREYKVSLQNAVEDAEGFIANFFLISPLPSTLHRALALIKAADKVTYPFDAYLAATMLDNGITRIITADAKDFAHFGLEQIVDITQEV